MKYAALILLFAVIACSQAKVEKYYCSEDSDCVDGEYCKMTEPWGCVNRDWWWENVGKDFDCMPDRELCVCKEKRCERR